MGACSRSLVLLLAAVGAPAASPTRPCNIPVFRYALERWPSEPYEVIVAHRGPIPADREPLLEALEGGVEKANYRVTRVDLARRPDALREAGLREPPGTDLPWLEVLYPRAPGGGVASAWSGPLSKEVVDGLPDSPVRREMVRRLLAGDSAVWLFLPGGQAERDEAAERMLAAELRRMEETLELPELRDDPDDKLASPIPLRLAFSLLRVSRDDPAERMLVAMLLRSEPDLEGLTEPMAFPVFGRGHALEALVGAGLNPENVADYCAFMVGPCSCQVKELNPGWDLLVAADWEAAVGPVPVSPPRVVPVLPLLGKPPDPAPADAGAPAAPAGGGLRRALLWAGLAMAGLAAGLAGARIARARRRPGGC